MRELIQNGAAEKNAAAAKKFDLGDRVTKLFALLRDAEEQAALTEDNRAFLQLCRNRLDELLKGHPVKRGTLINYGKISRVFGPDHVIRKGNLSFSIAKTLSSLEDAEERDYWYGQALLHKMSVSKLQAELSSRRGPASDITDRRKQSRAFVCAQTGLAITEDNLKTMVVVHLPSSGGQALQEPVKRPGKGKAATEAPSSIKAPPKLLRFRDMTALAAWSETHKREYPEAGSTPPLSIANAASDNAAGEREDHLSDTERHVTAIAPANDVSASSMGNISENSPSK